jgi:tight adherence protein B
MGCLLLGAVVVGWPGGKARERLRRRRWCLPPGLFAHPRRAVVPAVGAVAALGWIGGGPVAGVIGAAYSALAGRALLRRSARRRDRVAKAAALDGLSALAADLRAGLPPAARAVSPLSSDRIARLTSSVWQLAERTGAPAADLVERIEEDARAAERAAAKAAAQAAGAQSTALLLAGLPVAGIALGVTIGADPLQVLLHTPIGAACAIGAMLLQCGGLLWAERLAR